MDFRSDSSHCWAWPQCCVLWFFTVWNCNCFLSVPLCAILVCVLFTLTWSDGCNTPWCSCGGQITKSGISSELSPFLETRSPFSGYHCMCQAAGTQASENSPASVPAQSYVGIGSLNFHCKHFTHWATSSVYEELLFATIFLNFIIPE